MADEEELEAPESDEMGTIILMLGLYLIVLAFFILLNAISETSDVKVKKVSESVAEGFGFRVEGPVNLRDDVEVSVNPVMESIADDLRSVMESYVSVKDYRLITNSNVMVIRVESDRIFLPGQIRIRPAMADFFDDLASIVMNDKPGTKMVGDVIVNQTKSNLKKNKKYSVAEFAGRRSALFVRALIERGVIENRLSAGAVERKQTYSDGTKVQIFFEVLIQDKEAALKEAVRIMQSKGQL